ncbi:hypothetical protein [Thiohalobacter sp.]|uniref:hypothetical protein n=1 Tax=Thiohalobacter sp. TaxID=2025948 RepID=UPI00260D1F40|nr:hypothetical protein [Thiohalobacter sp.]
MDQVRSRLRLHMGCGESLCGRWLRLRSKPGRGGKWAHQVCVRGLRRSGGKPRA